MDRWHKTTWRFIKTDFRRMLRRNYQDLEYIQQIIKDAGCESYIQIKRNVGNITDWMTSNKSMNWNYIGRERKGEEKKILIIHRKKKSKLFKFFIATVLFICTNIVCLQTGNFTTYYALGLNNEALIYI